MRVKGNANGNLFNSNLTLNNPIILPEAGKYKMVVYTLLVCPYVSCSNAKDAIQITMKEDNSADYSKILFKLGTESGTNERKWKRQEILFETETSRISVNFCN